MSMFLKLTIELITGFIGLLISVRLIGRRQIQHITPFDFIAALVLSEILGNIFYSPDTPIYYMLFAILVWTILIYIIDVTNLKSFTIRSIIEGVPSLVIKKGKIQYDVLKKERIDFNELISLLRQKDIFAINEVDYAFIETSGAISVIKKSEYNQPSFKDLKLTPPTKPLVLAVICDGVVMKNNLNVLNLDETWLCQKLTENNINSPKEVMYAEWDQNKFYFQKFHDKDKKN